MKNTSDATELEAGRLRKRMRVAECNRPDQDQDEQVQHCHCMQSRCQEQTNVLPLAVF